MRKTSLIVLLLVWLPALASAQLLSGRFLSSNTVPVYKGSYLTNSPITVDSHSNVVFAVNGLPEGVTAFLRALPGSTVFGVTNIYVTNLISGDNALFSVPSGKRGYAFFTLLIGTNNVQYYGTLSTNGTFYKTSPSAPQTVAAGGGAASFGDGLVREENEGWGVNLNGPAPSAVLSIFLFDASIPWKTPRLLSLAAATNVVYTVPPGKTAIGVATVNFTTGPVLRYINNSGGPRVAKLFYQPAGLAAFPCYSTNTVADNSGANPVSLNCLILRAGDAVMVETDSAAATQTAWLSGILEIDE